LRAVDAPRESRGVNINFHPHGALWAIELTPNPLTVSEAFRPHYRTVFEVPGPERNQTFSTMQLLSLLSMALEEIAQEKIEPVECYH